MAELVSASDWISNGRLGYQIRVDVLPSEVFFKNHSDLNPSLDHLDQALLTSPPGFEGPELSDSTPSTLATSASQSTPRGSFISDFARETLAVLGFSTRNSSSCRPTTSSHSPSAPRTPQPRRRPYVSSTARNTYSS
ncbi:hypothetical protein B0H13DRAFT_2367920 [Mycena leptocephala]|nr:hypothetical protein B0H13DRAFT_2367920 [Mycena leptocephala]